MTPAEATPERIALADRADFAVIGRMVSPGSKVLDLGCGEGELLDWLTHQRQVSARGVEISAAQVRKAIARGVSAFQGDLNEGLADFPDQTFDYVILSQTLQEVQNPINVLRQMLRVGRRAIVSFPNFGHWCVRWSMLTGGRAPRTSLFPHEWHQSPSIHFLSVLDFEATSKAEGFHIEHREFLAGNHAVRSWPNLRAEVAVFLLA